MEIDDVWKSLQLSHTSWKKENFSLSFFHNFHSGNYYYIFIFKRGTFLLKFRSIFYGQDGKPKRGWRKTKRLDWTPSCPPENNYAKTKTNRCASALSQKGVGQDFINLEPQTCYRWFFHRIVWIRQGTDSFLGRQRRQGHRGAHPFCSPHNALIQMSD